MLALILLLARYKIDRVPVIRIKVAIIGFFTLFSYTVSCVQCINVKLRRSNEVLPLILLLTRCKKERMPVIGTKVAIIGSFALFSYTVPCMHCVDVKLRRSNQVLVLILLLTRYKKEHVPVIGITVAIIGFITLFSYAVCYKKIKSNMHRFVFTINTFY